MTTKKKSKKTNEFISAKEAAERLNLTEQQTRSLIRDGKLPATRVGKTWIIDEKDLPLAQNRPGRGRPSKKASTKTPAKKTITPATSAETQDDDEE
jgi:excisionase family DNA binding protein